MRIRKFDRFFKDFDPLDPDKLFGHHDEGSHGVDNSLGHERTNGPIAISKTALDAAGAEVYPVDEDDRAAVADWENDGGPRRE